MFDVTIVTERKYLHTISDTKKERVILLEDDLLKNALEQKGCKVHRTNWDSEFDWSSTKIAILRSVFDYFYRIKEFLEWMQRVNEETSLINSFDLVRWNIDKHYLRDLSEKGIPVCITEYVQKGEERSLKNIVEQLEWSKIVIKPAISATAKNTYAIQQDEVDNFEDIFQKLIQNESMLIQPFQESIPKDGEKSIMIFGGNYSHAVIKMATKGDFRVQSDFGGTVHAYTPSQMEIDIAERTVNVCETIADIARVDLIKDNNGLICVSELELIEPELWFRLKEDAADLLAELIIKKLS